MIKQIAFWVTAFFALIGVAVAVFGMVRGEYLFIAVGLAFAAIWGVGLLWTKR